MKFYWNMPKGLKKHYRAELGLYQNAILAGDLPQAWHHLERAHILGQSYPKEHSYVHWKMLQFGFQIKSWREIRGQILRLVFGGVKSFVGQIPVGNTGGANVPPLLPLEIPLDLKHILDNNQ
ncbi:MAG: DUF3703 domain-containing protein [Saprospiraceae bacterium]|jgi:hypothetical protein|nr:DUF3703 domain-containing protein [Saprospiraceae bacterium]